MDSPVMVVEEEVMSDVQESIEGMYQRKECIVEQRAKELKSKGRTGEK